MAHGELQSHTLGINCHSEGFSPGIEISRRNGMDGAANGIVTMQEIVRPCTRRRDEEGHDGRVMQHGLGGGP